MKRTISLIIAIAVMVAMFIVPVSAEGISDVADITGEGEWELDDDITGKIDIASGDYVIDLAGCVLTGQIVITGGSLTITDSSADKTGSVNALTLGDAIDIKGGDVTLDGITVVGAHTSGDAVFVEGSPNVTIKNCILTAGKVGIDATSAEASIVVENTTFADFEEYSEGNPKDARNAAIEFRNNANVELKGENKFEVSTIICRSNTHTASFADSFTLGENVTATFSDVVDLGSGSGNPYNATTITYSYNGTTTSAPSTTPDNGGSTSTPDNSGSTSTPNTNNNANTGDFMSLVIVVAAAALVVTVLSKKRAF